VTDAAALKVVVAPDKFAGTMSAAQAAAAIADGWRSRRPDDELVQVPMADGGAGTLDVVAGVVRGAERVGVEVADARGRARRASWLRLPDGRALVEAAESCGLAWLADDERDPRRTTTYGVGQLLLAAQRARPTEIVIGLGGSATSDGGAGMALALGNRLLRADGNGLKVGGEHLVHLASVEYVDPHLAPVVIARDVSNPLLGPHGAVAVFAPQKGASESDLPVLAAALEHFADIVERDVAGGPWRDVEGAGAAGGLGFGLLAFCGARMSSGAEAVASLVGLDDHLRGADVVIAGEGKLDDQTAAGKTPAFVAESGRRAGARVLAVAGQIEGAGAALFDAVGALGPEGLRRPVELTAQRAADLASTL
jgi:glycerate kinase